MDWLSVLFFIPACFALNISPGPNNLLALSNAKRYGFRKAVFAGLGRLMAFSVMIGLAASGLASVLYASENMFLLIKLIGAAYLFYLAYQLWITDSNDTVDVNMEVNSVWALGKQEFLLAAGNPKAILIFTAFLPQFIDPERAVAVQFLQLGGLFLLLEWLAISFYALGGVHLRQWFALPHMRKVFNRTCSGLLASAGVGLLLSRKD